MLNPGCDMPNGGKDCCGNCFHNLARKIGIEPGQEKLFLAASHCTLRDLNITIPFYTYCSSFRSYAWSEDVKVGKQPVGWVYAGGIYEKKYCRIPWNDKNEPKVYVSAECVVCGSKAGRGISVKHDGSRLGFCSNRHYIEWWKTIHKDDSVNPDDFEKPEHE